MKNHENNSVYAVFRESMIKAVALIINSTRNTVVPDDIISVSTSIDSLRIHNTDLRKLYRFTSNKTSKLVYLYLGHNKISEIAMDAFENLIKLKYLYLNNNQLSYIHDETFQKLNKLEIVWLNNNLLKEISNNLFSGNSKLQRLRLQSNEINIIEKDAFSTDISLKSLDFRKNKCINKSSSAAMNTADLITWGICECRKKENVV